MSDITTAVPGTRYTLLTRIDDESSLFEVLDFDTYEDADEYRKNNFEVGFIRLTIDVDE